MNDKSSDQIPDAYDAQGRPLFYHPPEENTLASETNGLPVKPKTDISDNPSQPDESLIKLKHDRSVNEFPNFDLEDDEYVNMVVQRHPAALAMIWISEVVIALALAVLWFFLISAGKNSFMSNGATSGFASIILLCTIAILVVAGFVSHYVFYGNKFVVTNQRVIQQIVSGLFFRDFQVAKLEMIEDISYKQSGILQYTFNYGTLRLSTVGDENTYTFTCVKDPAEQVREVSKILDKVRSKTIHND